MNEFLKEIISKGIITVDDIKQLTVTELLTVIIKRVNECHDLTIEHSELVKQLLNGGIESKITQEALSILSGWLNDGTFKTLMDTTLASEIKYSKMLMTKNINSDEFLNSPDTVNYIPYDLLFYAHPDYRYNSFQGLGYHNGYFYLGFDMGDGQSKIVRHSSVGKMIDAINLPLEHCAEIAYRKANGRLYVANGGGNVPCKVFEVDYTRGELVKTLDLHKLGNACLVAVDNKRDQLVVSSAASDFGAVTISFMDFDGNINRQIHIPNYGVPQGIDIADDLIYWLVNNRIIVMDLNGNVLANHLLNKIQREGSTGVNEPEGLTICQRYGANAIVFGYSHPARLYIYEPIEASKFTQLKVLGGVNSISKPNADLLLRRVYIGCSYVDGEWQFPHWDNYSCGIEQTTRLLDGFVEHPNRDNDADAGYELEIQLEVTFQSCAFFDVRGDKYFNAAGITPVCNLSYDGNKFRVWFYKKDGTRATKNDIPENGTIIGYVDGGVHMSF